MKMKRILMKIGRIKGLILVFFAPLISYGQVNEPVDAEEKYKRNFETAELLFDPQKVHIGQKVLTEINVLANNEIEDRKKLKGEEAVERVLLNCEGSLRRALAMFTPKRHFSHHRKTTVYYNDDKDFFYFFTDEDDLLANSIIAVHKETGYPYTITVQTLDAQKDLK